MMRYDKQLGITRYPDPDPSDRVAQRHGWVSKSTSPVSTSQIAAVIEDMNDRLEKLENLLARTDD